MTSTGIKQGYNENKPSSRVLKPPGGGASNIFGPDTKVEASPASKVNRMESNVFKEPEAGNQPVASKKEDTHNNLFGEHKMAAKTDFKPAIMKGHGYFKDPINSTGQVQDFSSRSSEEPRRPADSEVMHTRISQPPGGHCHQLW